MNSKLLHYYQKYMYVMGISGHFIFVLQAYKIAQTHSSSDVSLLGFLFCFWSVCSWFVYGFLINNPVLIRVNAFGVTAGLICLMMIIKYS